MHRTSCRILRRLSMIPQSFFTVLALFLKKRKLSGLSQVTAAIEERFKGFLSEPEDSLGITHTWNPLCGHFLLMLNHQHLFFWLLSLKSRIDTLLHIICQSSSRVDIANRWMIQSVSKRKLAKAFDRDPNQPNEVSQLPTQWTETSRHFCCTGR